jgi:phage FluMu protein Com
MRTIICIQCNETFITESTRKDKRMCPKCLRLNKIKSVMIARKKRIPTTEIGVGSGNSTKNINRPLTVNTYRKVKRNKCEICGSTKHLCVHHIDHNRNNNNLLNLQTVCKRCHQEFHVVRDEQGRYTRRIKTT